MKVTLHTYITQSWEMFCMSLFFGLNQNVFLRGLAVSHLSLTRKDLGCLVGMVAFGGVENLN